MHCRICRSTEDLYVKGGRFECWECLISSGLPSDEWKIYNPASFAQFPDATASHAEAPFCTGADPKTSPVSFSIQSRNQAAVYFVWLLEDIDRLCDELEISLEPERSALEAKIDAILCDEENL